MFSALRPTFAAVFLAFTALTATAFAETAPAPYAVGDALAPFTVKDQHEKEVAVTPESGTRHVVVSFVMGTGKDANRYFEKQSPTFLEQNDAVFLANIYGMPGIGRMFALPKMKKYPHRILLADDEHLLDRYPQKDGMLTVLDLNATGQIERIRFLDPAKDLGQLFAK